VIRRGGCIGLATVRALLGVGKDDSRGLGDASSGDQAMRRLCLSEAATLGGLRSAVCSGLVDDTATAADEVDVYMGIRSASVV